MTTQHNDQLFPDADQIGSRMNRIDPDIFRDQADSGPMTEDEPLETEENVFSDEPVDEEGDLTDMSDHGEHDHHQDDNYALGGHVTRSGSI